MSDEIKKAMEDEKTTQPELQEADVSQIIGGAFLKIEDIPGESMEDKHKDWIAVL